MYMTIRLKIGGVMFPWYFIYHNKRKYKNMLAEWEFYFGPLRITKYT